MSRAIADQGRTIRLPVHVVDQLKRVHRTERGLAQDLGRDPTHHEVGVALDLPELRDHPAQAAAGGSRLARDAGGRGRLAVLGHARGRQRRPPAPRDGARASRRTSSRSPSRGCPTASAQVVELRYGLDGEKPRTLEQVGTTLGVTRERVRQLEARALRDLESRHPDLRDYLDTEA